MPQLSLYMDEPTMEMLRANASDAGFSLSKYVSDILHSQNNNHGWPDGFFDLYGILADDDSFVVPPDPPFDTDESIPAFDWE